MNKLFAAVCAACVSLPLAAADFADQTSGAPQTVSDNDAVQVLNFWATFCKPCLKEMPAMSKWYQTKAKKQNIRLIGIALDEKDKVAAFLKTTPVSYPVWRYTGSNSRALMRNYGNTVGALPYTVVRMPKCGRQKSLLGDVDGAKLDKTIADLQVQCGTKQ